MSFMRRVPSNPDSRGAVASQARRPEDEGRVSSSGLEWTALAYARRRYDGRRDRDHEAVKGISLDAPGVGEEPS